MMSNSQIEDALSIKDLEHDCSHHLELRSRDKGKGVAYAYQCQFCGNFRGQEVSKKEIQIPPPLADFELQNNYQEKIEKITREDSKRHGVVSPTENIKPLKNKIEEFEEIINKFCRVNDTEPNSLIHSFLIRQRESFLNKNYVSSWSNESELHSWFEKKFSEWFEIYHEVKGTGFINRKKKDLRIDFIIKARKPLLEAGFTDQYIGIEAKYLNPLSGHGFHGKSSRGVFQALSYWYSGARWSLPNNNNVDLATVLIFSNLSFHNESSIVFDTFDSHYKKVWNSYLSIANHSNVGELVIRIKNNEQITWHMEYSRVRYFSRYENGFKKGNPDLINKLRIGSK